MAVGGPAFGGARERGPPGQNIGPGGADDRPARFRGAKCDRMGASAGVLPLGARRGGAVTGTANSGAGWRSHGREADNRTGWFRAAKCRARFCAANPKGGAGNRLRRFLRSKNRVENEEGRGFAVGGPARRSRDGDGKIAAPVGPVTGSAGFSRSKNRVENEEASIRARELQKATDSKTAVRGGEARAAKQTAAQGDLAQRNAAPALARRTQKAEGPRTRPFRLRRSGTRPKGGRRGAPPRRTPAPPVHRARRSCCRRRRARPYRCWCGPWTTKTPRCPSGWTRQRPYWTAYTARPREPIEGNGGAAVQVVMSKEVRELMG